MQGAAAALLRAPALPAARTEALRTHAASSCNIRAAGRPRRHCERRAMAVAAGSDVQAQPGTQEPSPAVLASLRQCDAVCFDVDSTFCLDESIDEIAEFLGVGPQVAELTARAMGGSVLFQDALAERLGVMRPSSSDIDRFLASHPHLVTPGIPQLVAALQASGRGVYLVSGGFRQVIHPLAQALGIPLSHVFANTILFEPDGSYAGFDAAEFTSRSGGKAEAVRHLRLRDGLRRVVMVGDGATDAEAKQPGGADLFVGYGGSVYRPKIAELADWYVMDIAQLARGFGFQP